MTAPVLRRQSRRAQVRAFANGPGTGPFPPKTEELGLKTGELPAAPEFGRGTRSAVAVEHGDPLTASVQQGAREEIPQW
jgi:hypothetical protein